ncbi:MAG: hypothetical protein JKY28_00070 [Sulfurimonas sp.]|nr:hypothetical protein [Sulfurimonas sp.]
MKNTKFIVKNEKGVYIVNKPTEVQGYKNTKQTVFMSSPGDQKIVCDTYKFVSFAYNYKQSETKNFTLVALYDPVTFVLDRVYIFKEKFAYSDTTISKDGSRVVHRNEETNLVSSIDTMKNKLTTIKHGKTSSLAMLDINEDGKYLNFRESKFSGKNPFFRYITYNLETKKKYNFTRNYLNGMGDVGINMFRIKYKLIPNAKVILYFSQNDKNKKDYDEPLKVKVYDLKREEFLTSFGSKGEVNKDTSFWNDISIDRDMVILQQYNNDTSFHFYNSKSNNISYCTLDESLYNDYKIFKNGNIINLFNEKFGLYQRIIKEKNICNIVKKLYYDEMSQEAINTLKNKQEQGTDEVVKLYQKITEVMRLHEAGFHGRANKLRDDVLAQDTVDVYHELPFPMYRMYMNHSEVSALAYVWYKRNKLNISEGSFNKAITSYIFSEAERGLDKHVHTMIGEYKKLIGTIPSVYQKDMLAIYETTYLLSIGKEKEAYNKLFERKPYGKRAISMVKNRRNKSFNPLYKNVKKLNFIFELLEKDVIQDVKYKKLSHKGEYGYGLDGKIVRGIMKKTKVVVAPKATPKKTLPKTKVQEAIEFLD